MNEQKSARLKYGGWGLGIGAAITIVLGFTWGGWVTAKTADKMSGEAVLASRAAICVAQFQDAPDHKAQLKAFEGTDSWKRYEYIEKGGWDKMPGEETARSFVSGACVQGIEALLDK